MGVLTSMHTNSGQGKGNLFTREVTGLRHDYPP